jgi:hypothetical protein
MNNKQQTKIENFQLKTTAKIFQKCVFFSIFYYTLPVISILFSSRRPVFPKKILCTKKTSRKNSQQLHTTTTERYTCWWHPGLATLTNQLTSVLSLGEM